jgi:argininosuccinate synthase
MKKLVLAYSGGLDTSYCLKKLSQEGHELQAVTVNTGGFSAEEIEAMKVKALQLGAAHFECISAEDQFYEQIIKYLIYGNVLRNNTYPLCVSAERIVQALALVAYAKANKADGIVHGSTGAGNDQVRFDMIFQIKAPEIPIITPIRDGKLKREEEIAYLKSQGVDMNWEKATYSVNKGLWGTSVGGKETLTSNQHLPEAAYPSPLSAMGSQNLSIHFKQGELVGINKQKGAPVTLIRSLQEIASKYAIGRDLHVGDTIVGIKGRVGYEAAAPLILIKAHHLLEKHTLSKWQQFQKEQLSSFYGMQLHEGNYLDPVMRDIEQFLSSSQKTVTGTVKVQLAPYRFELLGIKSKHDLMQSDFGQYGEENTLWTAAEAKAFIKVQATAQKIYQHVNNKA